MPGGTTRPEAIVTEALRNLRSNKQITLTIENRLRARCKSLKSYLLQFAGTGASGFPSNNNCGQQLCRFIEDITSYCSTLAGDIKTRTERAAAAITQVVDSRKWTSGGRTGFNDFGDNDLNTVDQWIENILKDFPKANVGTVNEDSPLLILSAGGHLESLAMQEGGSASQFISIDDADQGIMSNRE